ncbi:MAG: hypothetical protein RLZ23_573 [Actinomycetota bacterium]|jgi:hypothetical protein
MGQQQRKIIKAIAITIVLLFSSAQVSVAEPPPLPEDILKLGPLKYLFSFGVKCEGQSDLPHISRHKPGTVNVQARTSCPGKGVEITSRLTRTYRGRKISVTKSNQGTGQTTLNVSMKCIWKKGTKKVRYEISSVHRLSDGQIGYTYNDAELEC